MKDQTGIKGHLSIELRGPDGQIKKIIEVNNTVATAGKNGCADQLLASPSVAKPGWCEVGTSTPGATLLGAYISGSRTAFTSKTRGGNNVITMVTDFGAGVGTGAITEAGLFNVVTQNTVDMFCSASFAAINKGASDTLKITWTLTFN